MSANTKIEWATHTFNSWEGCQKVGSGCDNCYAEARNSRYAGGQAINWGPGAPRRRTSAANWRKPLAWNVTHDEYFALHSHRQRVFCASLADVFDNAIDPAWRADLFELIEATPNLDWLLLTKRIGNAWKMMADACGVSMASARLPLPNVWIGATVVNQEEADRDIPKLLRVPARVRFLSMEPLLGPVSFEGMFASADIRDGTNMLEELDWVIVGGESGPGARPMHPDWPGALRDQCEACAVPFLFKQWGEWLPISQTSDGFTDRLYKSRRVAKLHEDQATLDDIYGRNCIVESGIVHHDGSLHRISEPMAFQQGTGAMQTFKVCKKAAGRLLDGRTWDEVPS